MNAIITFRTTGDQREHLKSQAKAHDVTVSQLLREAVTRRLEVASREERLQTTTANAPPNVLAVERT